MPRIQRITLVLLFFVAVPNCALFAQSVRFRHLTTDDGLSQSYIYTIYQDRSGFVWLGTRDGLNRYDGRTFKQYHGDPRDTTTLPDNVVLTIAEDRKGNIWAGTNEKGIVRLDRRRDIFYRYMHSPATPRSISSNLIQSLRLDSIGAMWVATQNAGACRTVDGGVTWQRYVLGSNVCYTLCCGPDGTMWCGTSEGLFRFDRKANGFVQIPFASDDPPMQRRKGKVVVYDIIVARNGIVWMATAEGLARYNPNESGSARHMKSWHVNGRPSVIEDRNGILWMSTHVGLFRFRPEHFGDSLPVCLHIPGDPASLNSGHLFSLMEDRTGRIWAGGESGVNIVDDRLSWFKTLYPANNIRSIAELPDSTLWVGTQKGEIFVDGKEFTLHQALAKSAGVTKEFAINKLFVSSHGDLWVGTSVAGVFRYDPRTRSIRHFPPVQDTGDVGQRVTGEGVWAICEDADGDIWCGSFIIRGFSLGVLTRFRYDSMNGLPSVVGSRYIPFENVQRFGIWSLLPYHGKLLVATSRGLALFDNRNPISGTLNMFRNIPNDTTSLQSDNVWTLYRYSDSLVLCGTWGGGLAVMDTLGRFFSLTTREGLPNNYIYSVLRDARGRVWLTTNKGLSCLNLSNLAIVNYNADDGLQGNEFNPNAACLRMNGEMCFGGPNGVTVFHPQRVLYDSSMVPIVISAFRVFDKLRSGELLNGDTIRLSHADNHFSFEFAALDFGSPRKCQYAYQLVGLDSIWVLCGTRNVAFYTNIPPDTYIFHVAASNGDGVWNMRGVSIVVIIAPPWWQRWTFRFGAALVLLGGIAFFLVRRRLRLQRESQALEQARRGERRVLASELHDGPLQDLYATRFMLESAGPEQIDKAGEVLANVRSELRRICGELSLPKFDAGLRNVLETLIAQTQERHPETEIVLEYTADERTLDTASKEAIYFVGRTVLGNVVKHSGASRAVVRVESDKRHAALIVTDNGRGFQVKNDFQYYADNSNYGLLLAKSFAMYCGGDFKITSSPGAGTAVRLYIRRRNLLRALFRSGTTS